MWLVTTRSRTLALAAALVCAALGAPGLSGCSDDAPVALAVDAAAPPLPADAGPPEAAPPPLDVPAALVEALGGKTYVEGTCTPTTFAGWPYEAQRCTYRDGLVVVIANPPPERVARWIVDASRLIPALDGLRARDRASWEEGLVAIARHTLGQSSRIFPLSGEVWENGTAYRFDRGVTKTCGKGCYCRVNSTSRQQWCKYADAVLGQGDEQTCLATMGQTTSKLTEAWLERCLGNHVAAWSSDVNEHYRAMAWNANLAIAPEFPDPASASGPAVVAAVSSAYPR